MLPDKPQIFKVRFIEKEMESIIEALDSPIEEKLAYHAIKYISDDTELISQFGIKTICGEFRVDFIIRDNKGLCVAIECDGRNFHDEHRDEWRDAMILGDSDISAILRFKGADIQYHIKDLLYLTAKAYPQFFSERGRINLEKLASSVTKNFIFEPSKTQWRITFSDSKTNQIHWILVEHRHRIIPQGKRQFWQTAYKYAQSINGGNLDYVIAKYQKKI
jgi:very-short-patch-repair endonuclease